MLRMAKWVAVAGVLVAPVFALAHEGQKHTMGTVHEITADRIVVAMRDGKDAVFTLTPQTSFQRGDAPARRENVKVGERVVVHAKLAGDTQIATVVKLAASTRVR
jgi:hypothetical protein